MKRTRPATRKIGADFIRRRAILLGLPTVLLPIRAQEKEKKLHSVIAGTVFRDPGFALPGAEVELIEVREDRKKPKRERAITDGRGEFAFRMPAQDAKFKLKASARGLQSEEKEASAMPGVRVDVFFTLKPAAK